MYNVICSINVHKYYSWLTWLTGWSSSLSDKQDRVIKRYRKYTIDDNLLRWLLLGRTYTYNQVKK